MKIIKENALYRYNKGCGWCKHGIVYTMKDKKGQMWAVDTYWDSRFSKGLTQNTTYYSISDVADDLEFVMMIEDAKEINKNNFHLYDEDEKLHIPVGGWHERWLVNKNAKKNENEVIENIEYRIDNYQRKTRSLQEEIEKLNKWLAAIKRNPELADIYEDADYVLDIEYAKTRKRE